MSRVIQVNVAEIRYKKKMLLELTDDEIKDLVSLLEAQKEPRPGWSSTEYVSTLTPRMATLLHCLYTAPQETREEKIERGEAPCPNGS